MYVYGVVRHTEGISITIDYNLHGLKSLILLRIYYENFFAEVMLLTEEAKRIPSMIEKNNRIF